MIATEWIAVAVCLSLLALLVAGLVAWRLRRGADKKNELTLVPEASAGVPSPASEGAAEGAQEMGSLWWSAEHRRRPCLVVAGEAGSGASSLVGGLAGQTGMPSKGVSWRILEDVLFCDIEGGVFAAANAWDRALGALVRRRAQRPLDGLVLTVSASALLERAGKPEELALSAQTVRRRLDRLRERTGFVVPAYLVVTQCDRLPGFTALAAAMGPARWDDIAGWSCDRRLETSFSTDWVAEAIGSVTEALAANELALFGAGTVAESRKGLLLFPRQLTRLRAPLEQWLEPVFRAGAGAEPHLLRGIYFCGQPEPGASMARIFSRDLFEKKLRAEVQMARPAAGGKGARRGWSLAGKAVAASLALTLGAGVWWSHRRLAGMRDTRLDPLLEDLSKTVGEDHSSAAAPGRALNFLATVEALDAQGFYSLFLPWSWSDPVAARVDGVLAPAFRELVVETCRRGLEYRMEKLLSLRADVDPEQGPGEQAGSSGAEEGGELLAVRFEDDVRYVWLKDFIEQATAVESNLVRYERMAVDSGSRQGELHRLLEFLAGQQFSGPARLASNRRYRQVVAEAQWPPIRQRETFLDRAAHRARGLANDFLAAWIGGSALPDALKQLSASVSELEQGADGGDDSLERLAGTIDAVASALDDGKWDWAVSEFDRRRWGVLGKAIEQAPFGNDQLLAAIDEEGGRQSGVLRELLRASANSAGGPVADIAPGKIRIAGPVRELAPVLARLRSLAPVAAGPTPAASAAGMGFLWDTAALREVARTESAYASFVRDSVPLLPERFRAPLRRISALRVRGSAVANALRAREVNPSAYREGSDPQRTLLPEIRNAAEAASLYKDIAKCLDALGAPVERETLRRMLATHADELLAATGRELDRNPAYDARLARWDDTQPLSLSMYEAGSKAELRKYLDGERTRIATLANNYARPLLDALDTLGMKAGREHAWRWEQVADTLAAYAAARPGNRVRALESLVEEGLDRIRPEAGCAAPVVAPPGPDPFSSAERALAEKAVGMCIDALGSRYQRIAGLFNSRLAGRYPFTANSRPGESPGAGPADVGAFFELLDRDGAALEAALASDVRFGAAGRRAAEFLRRASAIRYLFSVPQGDSVPVMGVSADFRVNRARESGANQIIDWAMRVGDQSIGSGGAASSARWRHGDRTQVEFRYARDSLLMPGPETPGGPSVDGRTVTFDFAHPWSLIQMLRQHRAGVAETDANEAPGNLLRFRIPNQAPGQGERPASVVFVRLKLSAPGPATNSNSAAKPLPGEMAFPDRAPDLERPAGPAGTKAEKWSALR